MKTLQINEKNHEKSGGNTHKFTHISLDKCPRVPNLISK